MKANKSIYTNPYSKYRFSNDGKPKYIIDPYTDRTTVHGVELKAYKDNFKHQIDSMSLHPNVGNTTVINNILHCTQINHVDQPLNPNKRGCTFFRLFRLK